MSKKVFCIGFHKTGTTSLGRALELLGYRVCGLRHDLLPDVLHGRSSAIKVVVDQHDAFQDNPWPVLYRQLDHWYPESKFILSYRNPDEWIGSCVNHFGSRNRPMRRWIYGIGHPKGHEEQYLRKYQEHKQEVMAYFESRDNLLFLDLSKGDFNWEKLCDFLRKERPKMDFPYENVRSKSSKNYDAD